MKDFSLTVDGKKAEIINADYGMMAVKIPAGVHEIRTDFRPSGFYQGLVMSIAGIVILSAYLLVLRFYKKR